MSSGEMCFVNCWLFPESVRLNVIESEESPTHFRLFHPVTAKLTRCQLQINLLQYCQWRVSVLPFGLLCGIRWPLNWPVIQGLKKSARHLLLKGQVWGWREELIQWEAFRKSLAHQAQPEDQNHCIPKRKKKRAMKNAVHIWNGYVQMSAMFVYFNVKPAHWSHQALQEVCAKTQLPPERREDKRREKKKRRGKLLDFSPSHTSLLLLTPRPQSSIFHLLSVITSSKLGQWLGGRQQYNSQSGEGGTTRDSWEPLIDQLYSCLTEYPPKPMQTWGEKKLDHRPHSRQAWGSKCFVCLNYH